MILKASGIEKSYSIAESKTVQVLKGIDLSIDEGDFLAIMGHSGAGKSTLLHILASIDDADKGEIELNVNGKIYNYSKLNSDEFSDMRNKHIGFVFQFHHLLPEFTALENVMIPSMINGENYNLAKEKAMSLIDQVGIEMQKDQKPSELSGGEQQRVAIARALINDPELVFADEPTGNLDKKTTESILQLIRNLQSNSNKTFMIATHSEIVSGIAKKVVNITDGLIVEANGSL